MFLYRTLPCASEKPEHVRGATEPSQEPVLLTASSSIPAVGVVGIWWSVPIGWFHDFESDWGTLYGMSVWRRRLLEASGQDVIERNYTYYRYWSIAEKMSLDPDFICAERSTFLAFRFLTAFTGSLSTKKQQQYRDAVKIGAEIRDANALKIWWSEL